jgi:hypothetical protein
MQELRGHEVVDNGFAIRRASFADGPVLAQLCRRVPFATAGTLVHTDYGPDWWPQFGAVAGRHVFVAECAGETIGLHAVTLVRARVAAEIVDLALAGPTRIDPAMQGTGVFHALHGAADALARRTGAEPCAFVPVHAGVTALLPTALRRWPIRYERLVVDCRGVARASRDVVRFASRDAALALLDETYRDTALAPADPAAEFDGRLTRQPHRYGPDRLLTNGDAVLGVSRCTVDVSTSGAGGSRRQATALDVGAVSGAALESLVRAWCARLADDGIDDLVVWACAGSAVHVAIAPLARTSFAHALDLGLTPPVTAAERGIHVDASLL